MKSEIASIESKNSSIVSSTFVPPEVTEHSRHKTSMDNVRIIPPVMVFQDAYDGKTFKQSFSLMNCGKNSAFVRILAPSSKAFKLKTIPRGVSISAGLSITRVISYTHTSAMALPQASMWIYINEKPVMYRLEVNIIAPHVKLTPKSLDFGEVDAGTASDPMSLRLCNEGHKSTQFWVDLGRSSLELIVEPLRGVIRPLEVVEIKIEVLGSKLGSFTKEFWIKSEPPQRVNICGTFIPPKLVLEYPVTTFKFTLLDYPKTYLGASITKTVTIRNSSSSATMFTVVAEVGTKYDGLKTVMESNEELKCFNIVPREGRLNAQQEHILQITFAPKYAKSFTQTFSCAFIRIIKVNYRDGVVEDQDFEAKTFRISNDPSMETFTLPSNQVLQEFYLEDLDEQRTDYEHRDDCIRMCLYGEMEEAKIKLTPETFNIAYLRPNVRYGYELNIKNMSRHLPIVFQYNKTACIEIEPKRMTVPPSTSVEVLLSIKPTRMGEKDTTIIFDLIYEDKQECCKVGEARIQIHYVATMACPAVQPKFNMGITPKITHEVGFLVDDVRFNTAVEKPIQAIVDKSYKSFNKNNNDLIALPNDRPKTLRPWRNEIPCRTIYANIPRYVNKSDEYAVNSAVRDANKSTKQFYVNYIRSESKKRHAQFLQPHALPHYNIDKEKRILMEGVYFSDCSTQKSRSEILAYTGIPLPPERLIRIQVKPKAVSLGKIAPYTICTDSFNIQNDNEFAVNVVVKALSNSIVIKGKKMMTIGPRTTKNILFDCWSHGLGKYFVPVFVIVNDCHIFDAMVYAKVVPTTVLCPNDQIQINPKYNVEFFEIYNPVNCDISFSWEVQDENFDVYPSSGSIPARRSVFCRLTFHSKLDAVYKTEIYLLSQNGAKQIIKVVRPNVRASVEFNEPSMKFENIPLNLPVTKELVLRNFSDTEVVFVIRNPNPVREVAVTPKEGKISPKADAFFEVTVDFRNVVAFKCSVEFLIQDEFSYFVEIEGNVVYPAIELKPDFIQIPKIIAGSLRRRAFKVTNASEAQSWINFCFEDFPELRITDLEGRAIDGNIVLEANEIRELYLEFRPLEATVYSMFLPFVLNGLVGPAALNDPRTVDPNYYFDPLDEPFKVPVDLPDTLSLIRLRCATFEPWFKFSPLDINFPSNDRRIRHLIITNISSMDHQITVPRVEPQHPFTMGLERSDVSDLSKIYFTVYLEPGEEVVYDFEFNPTDFGVYSLELPIFVDKNLDPCPFNYIRLTGTYEQPTIVCSKRFLYYQFVPISSKVTDEFHLELRGHAKGCLFDVQVHDERLSVEIPEIRSIDEYNGRITVTLTFDPREECYVESKIEFKCSCGSSYALEVRAAASDSYFDCYASFMKSKAVLYSRDYVLTFPLFPNQSADYYATKMNLMLADMETWMFSQGFFYRNYFKIPHGMCRIPLDITNRSNRKIAPTKRPKLQLPLVKLLINLTSASVVKYFFDSTLTPTTEGVEGAIYLYSTYRNILSFLKSQKVYVLQLEPEYLLPYKQYVMFREHVEDPTELLHRSTEKNILSRDEFNAYSTQCWIDLLLRTYKVFVFNRAVNCPNRKYDKYHHEFMIYFQVHRNELPGRTDLETKLLLWLQYHFDKQKAVLWDLELHPHLKEEKRFVSFEINVCDGLGFATLLAAYCPYMKKYLQNFYPGFESDEQMFHNFCVIHQVMRKINLSYVLTPPHLIKPSTAEMIMTVAYLYEVLPGFLPKETISLESPLGQPVSNEITLMNPGNVAIAYTPIFFWNSKNDFEVSSDCIILPPKKKITVKVTYNAKSVLKKRAILLLSGETPGHKYATSKTITLIGTPKLFTFTIEHTFKVDAYTLTHKRLVVESPYEKRYRAKLYLYMGDVSKTPESLDEFIPVSTYTENDIPREICSDPVCAFNTEGVATIDIKMCFVSCGKYTYFAYFLNEEVGDFAMKLDIHSYVDKGNVIDLEVPLPKYFSTAVKCMCAQEWGRVTTRCHCYHLSYECSKLIVIEIPYRNEKLMKALRTMIKTSTSETESKFWLSIMDQPKGFHVFRNYLYNTYEDHLLVYRAVMNPKVTYALEFTKKKTNYPSSITFEDVSVEGVFKLPMHWNGTEQPKQEILRLTANNGQEIRQYRLTFKPYGVNNMLV